MTMKATPALRCPRYKWPSPGMNNERFTANHGSRPTCPPALDRTRSLPPAPRLRLAVQALERELARGRVHRHRVAPGEAGGAVASRLLLAGEQPFVREVAERVGAEVVADLLDRLDRADQLAAAGGVDAVEAGMRHRRRADAEVHLLGAVAAQHAHQLAAGRAAHDRVVHQHDPLAGQDLAHRVELDAHAGIPLALMGLDEGAADVMVAD